MIVDDARKMLAHLKVKMNDERRIKSKTNLRFGDIIEMDLDENDGLMLNDGYATRRKFVVIIGKTSNGDLYGAFLVNSEISFSKFNTEMLKYQYPMLKKKYPEMLDYDSWLDCSDLFDLKRRKIIARKAKHISHLSPDDEENIRTIVVNSEVMTEQMKKKLGITL